MLEGMGVYGTNEEMKSYVKTVKQQIGQLVGDVTNMWVDGQKQRIQSELKAETEKVDRQAKGEMKSLDERKRKGLITEKQYEAEKEKIEAQAAKKKDALNREAFEKNKRLQLVTAVINGAQAILAAAMTPVIGLAMSIIAGAMVALQIKTIAGTKYEGAKGGLLRGKSHREGGIKYQMGGDIVELEGGEAVINKQSVASSDILSLTGTPRQIASAINSYRGYGIPFASGGFTPAATPRSRSQAVNSESIASVIAHALNDQRVYVVETDITETQNRVKKINVESQW
jgi:hypothetical protein